jgi:CrcB protein
MRFLLIIGAGGFLGTIARYLLQQSITKLIPVVFPYGTLAVNILGCFLIGIFYSLGDRTEGISSDMRFFLTTGFCGGFTTFSTFSFESYQLLQQQQYAFMIFYITLSVVLGIVATIGAIALMRMV